MKKYIENYLIKQLTKNSLIRPENVNTKTKEIHLGFMGLNYLMEKPINQCIIIILNKYFSFRLTYSIILPTFPGVYREIMPIKPKW